MKGKYASEDVMKAFIVSADGTVRDINGNIVFFSFERFKEDICKNGHCFVCGASDSSRFNDEHVIPDWVLRLCGLHNERLTLPNGARIKYGRYKIQCCAECNRLLGDTFEVPARNILSRGYDELMRVMTEDEAKLLRVWLCLVFLKVHLRDFRNRASLDQREDAGVIGDYFDLSELHHVHAVARAMAAGVQIDNDVFGSLVMLQASSVMTKGEFDYCDYLPGQGILLRIKDIALIYIINDCGAIPGMLEDQLSEVPCPASEIVSREVLARYLAANLHITNRPVFRTEVDAISGVPKIAVTCPDLEFENYRPEVFGGIFAFLVDQYKDNIKVDGVTGDEAIEFVRRGGVSFLRENDVG